MIDVSKGALDQPSGTATKLGKIGDDEPDREVRWAIALFTLFFIALGGGALFVPLNAAVVAQGEVTVSGSRVVVQHRDGGIVSRVHVSEGDLVDANQVLLDLADVELVAQERALAQQFISLVSLRARLDAEVRGELTPTRPIELHGLESDDQAIADSAWSRQLEEMQARRNALETQRRVHGQREQQLIQRIAGHEAELRSLDTQESLIGRELEGIRRLADRGFAPLTRVWALERTEAELAGRRGSLTSSVAQAREAIGEARLQGLSVTENHERQIAEQLRNASFQIAEIEPRLRSVRFQLERTRVRAPIAGTIVASAFRNIGAVVRPGDRILDIVPASAAMVIEARVLPRDADDVVAGDEAQVRLTAIEGRNMPRVAGRVVRISADSFDDDRSGASYFVMQVEVSERELDRLATEMNSADLLLSPGLPVDVVVSLRSRTAMEYLLEPLAQSVWTSFREP